MQPNRLREWRVRAGSALGGRACLDQANVSCWFAGRGACREDLVVSNRIRVMALLDSRDLQPHRGGTVPPVPCWPDRAVRALSGVNPTHVVCSIPCKPGGLESGR